MTDLISNTSKDTKDTIHSKYIECTLHYIGKLPLCWDYTGKIPICWKYIGDVPIHIYSHTCIHRYVHIYIHTYKHSHAHTHPNQMIYLIL